METDTVVGLVFGDRIRIDGATGEVLEIRGPHGPLGTPATTDWYTLRVLFDPGQGLIADGRHPSTVGPMRGNTEVERVS